MQAQKVAPLARVLGIASCVLAVLGLVLYWWLPMGLVLSLSGLTAGFIGLVRGPRRGGLLALLCVGVALAVIALGVDLAAVQLDLIRVRFDQ